MLSTVLLVLLGFVEFCSPQNTTAKPASSSERTTSSEYCDLDKTRVGNRTLTWRRSQMGTTAYSNEFCADGDGRLAKRNCDSDPERGAVWAEVRGSCSGAFRRSEATDELNKLFVDYVVDGHAVYGKLRPISEQFRHFTYADQCLLSRIFYAMTLEDFLPRLLQDYGPILNNIMEVDVGESGPRLKTFEPYNYTLAGINVFFKRIADEVHNLTSIHTPHFVFEISNPFADGVTGFALYETSPESFLNYTVRKIRTGEGHGDIPIENLEVAGYVSGDLLDYIQRHKSEEEREKMKILIAAFHKNKLFNTGEKLSVVSRIVAVSISGFCGQEDVPLFDIFLKPIVHVSGEWFVVQNNELYNGDAAECFHAPITYMFLYDNEGVKNGSLCKTAVRYPFAEVNVHNSLSGEVQLHDDLSPFDVLSTLSMSINYAQPQTVVEALYKKHDHALRIIMFFGCSLSLIGVMGLLLTVLLIKNWHQRRWYSLQLMISMTLETVLFLVNGDTSYVAYIVLYYFILSQFAWMMLIGYTQYKKFVMIFKGADISASRSLIVGWLVPLLVVLVPVCIYPGCLRCKSCAQNGTITTYFVVVPTSLVILGNIVIYALIMLNVSRSKCREFGIDISRRQTRLALLLPFMLGLTWAFLFALVSPWGTFALVGTYLFHIIAPIQAFVLFIFIVVMDSDTRKKWREMTFAYKKNKVAPVKTANNNNNCTKTVKVINDDTGRNEQL